MINMLKGEMPSPIPMEGDAMIHDSLLCTPPIPVSSSASQRGFKTPNKVAGGQYFSSRQFQSPSVSLANRLQQASPCLHTPSSGGRQMMMKTPGSAQGFAGGTRGTPRYRTPSSASRARNSKVLTTPKFLHTPNGVVYNPFENHLDHVDQLNGPVFSPNVFSSVATGDESQSPQSFRWSIDQLAILKPADIEENGLQEDMCVHSDNPELEERAQKAIDEFFSNQYIAPSPWTESKKSAFQLPRTPGNESFGSPMVFTGKSAEKKKVGKKDVCCQTALTLPLDFDLEKILGEHYTYQEPLDTTTPSEELSPLDLLSTSSLRRKLFSGEGSSPPTAGHLSHDQLQSEECDQFDQSPEVSPVKCTTPGHLQRIPKPSPGAGHFSSSPISSKHLTPSIRRCSDMRPTDGMKSPEISPIALSAVIEGMDTAATPLSKPMQGTPSTLPSRLFGSPAMSPIPSHGGFLMSSGKVASNQGVALSNNRDSTGSTFSLPFGKPFESPSAFMKEDIERQFSPIFREDKSSVHRKEYVMTKLQDADDSMTGIIDMRRSIDCADSFHKSPEVSEPKRPLSIPRDFEFGDHDDSATQDPALHGYFQGSDTGYHTNSLQLTNQDTASQSSGSNATGLDGLLHSNLTNQFGSLPFNAQDTGVDLQFESNHSNVRNEPYNNTQYFMKNVPKGLDISGCELPEQRPTKNPKFGQLKFDEDPVDSEPILNQDEVIRRARRALTLNLNPDDS